MSDPAVPMADPSRYVPTIFARGGVIYGQMLVELSPCPTCGLPMLDAAKRNDDRVFPRWYLADIDAQLKRANWRRVGRGLINGERICEQCTTEGRGGFDCALCGERRSSSQIKESFGDPPEYLCTVCYETRPAKEWDAKVGELEQAHQWDFG